MRKAHHIIKANAEHGEGPLWDHRLDRLYWVDILQGKIHYAHQDEDFQTLYTLDMKEAVGVVGLCGDPSKLVAGLEKNISLVEVATAEKTAIATPTAEPAEGTRFNEGKVSPAGQFFAGTMADGVQAVGNLYRLDADQQISHVEKELQVTNGMDWSVDRKTFYLTDSPKKLIYAYDYDLESGTIANRRVHIDSTDLQGVPDGLCIDQEGCIWSARWEGGMINRFDPEGKLMEVIELPVLYPTSCCFGGEKLDQLFVSTSQLILPDHLKSEYPNSGDIFVIPTETRGFQQNLWGEK